MQSSSEGFLVIQFGLSCFRFDEAAYVPLHISCAKKKNLNHLFRAAYDVSTFNFYIFPQQLFSVDRRFHCQSGSIRFLASHQFDFNQVRL